jgi:surface protein
MKKILLILLCLSSAYGQFIATTGSGGTTDTPPFKFGILTGEADDTLTLPLVATGTYNCTVNWGDASSSTITAWDDADKAHTYADEAATAYSIEISGTLIGWEFDNIGDSDHLMRDITQWGIFRPGNNGNWFKGCHSLTVSATDRLNMSGVTDANEAFQLCQALTTIPSINNWDWSNVTSLYGTWHSCSVFNQDLSGMNLTTALVNLGYTFYGNTLFNGDITTWPTDNVTTMTWMFYSAPAFNQNISVFHTSKVASFDFTFRDDIAFDQDLSALDFTGVTTANGMFFGVTLSTANYSALLIALAAQDVNDGVVFGGGSSLYSAGDAATARAHLVDVETGHSWVITDGGQEP